MAQSTAQAHAAPAVAPAEAGPEEAVFPPVDLTAPQLTVRAIVTGMLLGGVLSLCNVYSGLKIGWGFNMSITAALLAYGFWNGAGSLFGARRFGLLENNINQTAASSAASISSAGLVAPIPALTMMTGQELGYLPLVLWVVAVSLVGVVVAIGLRRQMLVVDKLPFPSGIATAETVREMYARGKEAMARVKMLLLGAGVAAALKVLGIVFKWSMAAIPGSVPVGGVLTAKGVSSLTMANLGFKLDPSLLLVGSGAIIGIRAGASLLFGAVLAWIVLGPYLASQGVLPAGKPDPEAAWYGVWIKDWFLWPGVSMMVLASLTSLAFSWRSIWNAITRRAGQAADAVGSDTHEVPRRIFLAALFVALVIAVVLQVALFEIGWAIATFGILLTFALAVVAGRVSGETGVTPVGPMGKVTQLAFGLISPANATANLMAANVTGGAASQCADLLHDMKTGALIGASPRYQAYSQFFGVLAGGLAGSAAYLVLIPEPQKQLLTEEWPAPAVLQWKAVAEAFTKGLDSIPSTALWAALWAGLAGILLAILEKTVPKRAAKWIPSPASIGLAFVLPAHYSLSMFLGAFAGVVSGKFAKAWTARFLIVLAAGLIAGESLVGVGHAIIQAVEGLAK